MDGHGRWKKGCRQHCERLKKLHFRNRFWVRCQISSTSPQEVCCQREKQTQWGCWSYLHRWTWRWHVQIIFYNIAELLSQCGLISRKVVVLVFWLVVLYCTYWSGQMMLLLQCNLKFWGRLFSSFVGGVWLLYNNHVTTTWLPTVV